MIHTPGGKINFSLKLNAFGSLKKGTLSSIESTFSKQRSININYSKRRLKKIFRLFPVFTFLITQLFYLIFPVFSASFTDNTVRTLDTNANWWDTNYDYRQQISVKNTSAETIDAYTTTQIVLNTKALYDAGKLQNDCDDLRITYGVTTQYELPRYYDIDVTNGATDCSNSVNTTIYFKSQGNILSNGEDSNYYIYFGNSSAVTPTNWIDAFDKNDGGSIKEALLAVPFEGDSTGVNNSGAVTPSTSTGAIRYQGQKSAMVFDGSDDRICITSGSMISVSSGTVELWVNPQLATGRTWPEGNGDLIFSARSTTLSADRVYISQRKDGNLGFSFSDTNYIDTGTALSSGGWSHVALVWTGSTNVSVYLNGSSVYSGSRTALPTVPDDICLGRYSQSSTMFFNGIIDEVKVSDTARYTSNFTPAKRFERDEHTKLLYHFDEFGDMPYEAGTMVYDDSGNGNDGTVTGATWVDTSQDADAPGGGNGYLSKNGVFIEEGTTNLITNPSFDNATYDTNWYIQSFDFNASADTFTPAMAKRNSAGPFAAGPMVQGNLDGSGTSDYMRVSPGTAINGYFYPNFDEYQGTIVFWITPEWNGNDNIEHFILRSPSNLSVYKSDSNYLHASVGGVSVNVNVASWVVGSTYNVVFRWDSRNALNGAHYGSLSVNDSHVFSDSSAEDTGAISSIYVGATGNPADPANAIIEGLTIYRRPLFDGTYGIDVGNGDEIAKIYDSDENPGNGITSQDPTLVTGSWDVVFALPTNATTEALSSPTDTDEAWSHPHASNVLYTDATNTGGFMMGASSDSDGWAATTGSGLLPESLNNNLEAFWRLEETSGTRFDYFGSNDLTDNNTVTRGTGKIGYGAEFSVGNKEYLSINDNPDLSSGDIDFTIAGWVYLHDNSNYRFILSKGTTGDNKDNEYQLFYTKWGGANTFAFDVGNGSTSGEVTSTSFGHPSLDTWYYIVAWHDASANTINIQVNNGTVDSASYSSGAFDSEGVFRFGQYAGSDPGTTYYWDGMLDGFGFWKRVLTIDERNALYNSGNGAEMYPISSLADDHLKAYWMLNETSGTRYDSVNSNDLTDNNTVTQATGILDSAAQFSHANSEYLSITDNDDLSTGDIDYSIAVWVYIDSIPGSGWMSIVTKWEDASHNREYWLGYNGTTNRFEFFVSWDGYWGWSSVAADNLGAVSTNTWYYIVAWHDSTANTINIQVNNGLADSTAHSNGSRNGVAPFTIGKSDGGDYFWNGRIDAVGFWKRVLTVEEKTSLYNGGSGFEFPFGSQIEISPLSTDEKVYAGGYKWTNTVANQGIYYPKSGLTAGQNYVVRALAHSDTTSIPKIQIWDATNGAEITQMTASDATATRTAPEVFNFTFELPTVARNGVAADCTSIEVRLLNTEASGTVYWHQVELLANLIDNPSMETGAVADPWIPDGWGNINLDTGESLQDIGDYHSGGGALLLNSDLISEYIYEALAVTNGIYYSVGTWAKETAGSGDFGEAKGSIFSPQAAGGVNFQIHLDSTAWKHKSSVARAINTNPWLYLRGVGGDNRFDDVYCVALTPVTLTVTPASEANSTETTGLRVDGRDTATQTISNITATSGTIRFKYTPRHSAADVAKFGVATPYVVTLRDSGNDYIRLYWSSANTLALAYVMDSVGPVLGTWDASGSISAGTTYNVEIAYAGGGNMIMSVDGVPKITLTGIPTAFGVAPTLANWGTSPTGDPLQADATFDAPATVLTVTENTTTPFYKVGSKSVKIVNGSGTEAGSYVTPVTVGNTNTHTLSAYVYDGTTGNVGGTVSATVAKLVFNGAAVTPAAYTDMGGGWWRLTYSAAAVSAQTQFGVQVLAGKTIYVDGVQLEAKAFATTYCDGELDNAAYGGYTGAADGTYIWSGTTHASTSARSAANVSYFTISNMGASAGTISFWVKPNQNENDGIRKDYLKNRMGGSDYIQIYKGTDNVLRLEIEPPGVSASRSMSSVTKGSWHHIVATWTSGSSMALCLDASCSGSEIPGSPDLNTTFNIGNFASSNYAQSVMANFQTFSSALSSDEVADLYYAGFNSQYSGSELPTYQQTTNFESNTIDISYLANWNTLSWNADLPTGVGSEAVKFQLAVKDTDSGWTDSDFLGSDCTNSTYWVDDSAPHSVDLTVCPQFADAGKRYARFRVFLETADQTVTPTESAVTIFYEEIPPYAPSDFSGTVISSTSIQWNWTDNSDYETGFKLLDSGNNVIALIPAANTEQYTEGSLDPNTSYTRKVVAYNDAGDSTSSNTDTQITLSTPPTAGNIGVDTTLAPAYTFTNNISGGFGGEVEYFRYVWDTNPNHTFTGTEDVWNTGVFGEIAINDSDQWHLHLQGYNSADVPNGTLNLGPYASLPNAPSDMTGTAGSSTSIYWSWTDNSNIETGFKVYDSGNNLIHTISSVDTDSWDETGLSVNTQYTRSVSAFNLVGESGKSNNASIYTLANVPGTPKVISLGWTALNVTIDPNGNPDNTEYAIYESETGMYLQDDNTLGSNPIWHTYFEWGGEYGKTITNLVAAEYYYLHVIARNGDYIRTPLSNPTEGIPFGFVNEYDTDCKTYTVKQGDYLEGIAQSQLGNKSKYTEIINLNLDRYPSFATNKNFIKTGWTLVINCDQTDNQNDNQNSQDNQDQQDDQNQSDVEVDIDKTGNFYTVSILVIDKDKQPIKNAKVTLHSAIQEQYTDTKGIVTFSEVEKGNHTILVAYNGMHGEQKVNLEGETQKFEITVELKSSNTTLIFLTLIIVTLIIIVIILLLVIKRKNRIDQNKT